MQEKSIIFYGRVLFLEINLKPVNLVLLVALDEMKIKSGEVTSHVYKSTFKSQNPVWIVPFLPLDSSGLKLL